MLSKSSRRTLDPQDEIVISGVSGRFPNSDNVAHFARNLFDKVDLVDDEEKRWKHTNPEIPKRMGTINNLEKFDASFFGVHAKVANLIDPQCRVILEHAYEAVIDAGINPKSLRGTKTGVYVGCCFSESEKTLVYEQSPKDGLGISGNSRALMANRISFVLGTNGPSYVVDTACSSSMYALDSAYTAMINGECDMAIVGGSNLLLHPFTTLQFARLGVLAADGVCRPFDQKASGYSRAEAVSVLFLQRRRDAKRIYSQVVYSKTNCDGFKNEGLHYPSGLVQKRLLHEFYEDIGIAPSSVAYVEAHSTGTVAGDPEECIAIDDVFSKGRKGPLLIGSVKSNMGHSEATSGICSIIKTIIAQETQKIPPNINFTHNREGIPSLVEGRLKVVSEPTDLPGDLISVNSFGFGGANAHALFRSNPKVKLNKGIPKDDIPRLVVWSGRSDEAINSILDSVTKQPLDAEYVALLQHAQLESTPANLYRGFGVFTQSGNVNNATAAMRDVQHFNGVKRPVVWMYSGMGSQWSGMGRDLMKIPIFNAAIEKCQKSLDVHGLNLKEIITSDDATMFDNILHSFVGIAAVQIGLTDILTALKLKPDIIIGHSVGELGCAYADGCMTAEEMILSAYSRGMASIEAKVVKGSMAAVGLGFSELSKMLPEGVEIACHNSAESSTISGPAGNIAKFVEDLKTQGVFAKEVACSNIPYHSSFIAKMGPVLLNKLKGVIKCNKKRSSKWISSSFPEDRWNDPKSQLSSPEYHTNNLLSPVLFEEASALLPKDAMIIEIAPHGLLQAIVKRSFPDAVNIPLTQRSHRNNDQFMFGAIGKIYVAGFDLDLPIVFPAVEFPVSRGTQMISPNYKWDHSYDLFVPNFLSLTFDRSAERKIQVELKDPLIEFMAGHVIDGRCLLPATGYLYFVWDTYAHIRGRFPLEMGIEFEDVKFLRATTITEDTEVELTVIIQPGTGRFEISEGSSTLVTGFVREVKKFNLTEIKSQNKERILLPSRDFYKELRLRGYHYGGLFKSVEAASADGLYGRIKWYNNWIGFLDCLLQIQILGQDTRSLILPTAIQRMTIDSASHYKMIEESGSEEPVFDAYLSNELKTIRCGGIEIVNLQANIVGRRRPPGIPVLESYKFVPYHQNMPRELRSIARIIVQIALENAPATLVKAVEVDGIVRNTILTTIRDTLEDLPLVTPDLTLISSRTLEAERDIKIENTKASTHANCLIFIASNSINNSEVFSTATKIFSNRGFLVCRENPDVDVKKILSPEGFSLIASIKSDSETFVVFQFAKVNADQQLKVVRIPGNDSQYKWLDETKAAIQEGPTLLVAENEPLSGLLGLVNCLRREPNGSYVSCMLIDDVRAPKFSLDDPFYQKQLQHGLAVNIFKDGAWGSYRHLQAQRSLEQLPNHTHCYVNALIKSDLSSLKWISGPFNYSRPKGELVKVQYAALNFRDVMLATGKISGEIFAENRLDLECVLGMEYAGVTSGGQRVMGMTSAAALSTYVEADDGLTFECPQDWTLAQAATVPIVYGTVYAAFFITTKIQKGKSVLIHAGSGGIGLAAIRVAFAYGLEVFTTVSTAEKKKFLLNEFPQLKEKNIGNSRDTSFENLVMTQTKGKGVDYVLNSLAEDKLLASVRCLGKGGKFLEIGKFDMANDTKIGLGSFLNELSFHAVMVDRMFKASLADKKILSEIIERDIKSGIIKPLKTNIFNANEVEQAFRLLASGKHVGKVLLKIRENEMDAGTMPIAVVPRVYCNADASYIICGGLGGFGLELADWLVLRGCKKLVLSSSRGITKQYQSYRIKIWESYGVQVVVKTADITIKAGCEQLIRDGMKLGPVGGIFNLAVVLQDGIFDNQDAEKFTKCMAPKADATKHLDEISRKLCPNLQYFVVFSSVSCGRGNAGQSNYGMANSVMEKIMEQRNSLGLPAKAIQWGAVGEVGLVADMAEDKIDLEIGGTLQQRISSCLEELDNLMAAEEPIMSSMVVAEKRYNVAKGGSILDTVMNIMGVRDIKSISLETTLTELGMDSLMAVELKQIFERDYEIMLSTPELRALNFLKIMEFAKAMETKSATGVLKIDTEKAVDGLQVMVTCLGDEANSDVTILSLDDAKPGGKYKALMIPGIEGVAGDPWYHLSKALNFKTSILQLKSAWQATTIDEIVKIVQKDVTAYFADSNRFHLIAHSYGSTVALKFAAILEASGKSGHVTFIDGSPWFLKSLITEQFKNMTSDDEVRNHLLEHILTNIFTDFPEKGRLEVFKQATWELKIKTAIQLGIQQNLYSDAYLTHILNALVNRMKSVIKMDPNPTTVLKSSATLIRPSIATIVDISEDYDLQKHFEKKIEIKYIKGTHLSILESPEFVGLLDDLQAKTKE